MPDPDVRREVDRLGELIADAIVGDARDRDAEADDAEGDGPGRVLATVDGREYAITVGPNTEQAITATVPPSQLIHRQRELLAQAMEFYVRVPIDPLSHVVVRRDKAGVDLWAVTDGAVTGLQVWVDGRWQYVGDTGRQAAFCWPLERAMKIAEEAAEAEAQQWRERGGQR